MTVMPTVLASAATSNLFVFVLQRLPSISDSECQVQKAGTNPRED